jgi:hypothetical protein
VNLGTHQEDNKPPSLLLFKKGGSRDGGTQEIVERIANEPKPIEIEG